MNDTRRRMLTEYLGECWHEISSYPIIHNNGIKCVICKKYAKHDPSTRYGIIRRTFTTSQDMVDLGKRMMVNGDWNPFYCDTFNDWYARNRESVKNTEDADAKFVAWLLFTDPARTCKLIAEWMEDQ